MAAYPIAQANARLTRITTTRVADGGSDDWDTPGSGTAPVEKWAGDEPAYFTTRRTRTTGEQADVVATPTLIVSMLLAEAAGLTAGDTLTYSYDGAAHVATVAIMSGARLDGVPVEVQTARLELQPA